MLGEESVRAGRVFSPRYGDHMTRVQLFVTCLVDGFAPDVGEATVTVLERAGCTVAFPEAQSCCGQPAYNAGLVDDARAMAAYNVAVLDATDGPVVLPSGSCTDMFAHHIPELATGTPWEEAARRVARRVRELTQFLVDDLGISDLGASCAGCRVVYHSSCHGMRNLGLGRQARALIDALEGSERVEPAQPEQCCGFGGLFAVEMPEVSTEIMDAKLDDLEATGADLLVGGDLSCLLHLEGGLHRRGSRLRVRHIAELLAGEP